MRVPRLVPADCISIRWFIEILLYEYAEKSEVNMNATQIIMDALMVCAAALIIFVTVKKGFVKSFFKSMKMIIVLLVTVLIGACLADVFADAFVADIFDGKISSVLVEMSQSGEEKFSAENVHNSLPDAVKNIISSEMINDYFAESGAEGVELAREIGEKTENALTDTVSKIISYIAVFLISFIVCSVAIILLDGLFKLPVLKTVNKVMGLLLGASYAYAFLSIAVCLCTFVLGVDTVEGTFITKIIYKIGLFTH